MGRLSGSRLLKNAHLPFGRLTALSFAEGLRCATPAYEKYASFLMILHALHPDIFEQPVTTCKKLVCSWTAAVTLAATDRAPQADKGF